jgi:hypothetical protein
MKPAPPIENLEDIIIALSAEEGPLALNLVKFLKNSGHPYSTEEAVLIIEKLTKSATKNKGRPPALSASLLEALIEFAGPDFLLHKIDHLGAPKQIIDIFWAFRTFSQSDKMVDPLLAVAIKSAPAQWIGGLDVGGDFGSARVRHLCSSHCDKSVVALFDRGVDVNCRLDVVRPLAGQPSGVLAFVPVSSWGCEEFAARGGIFTAPINAAGCPLWVWLARRSRDSLAQTTLTSISARDLIPAAELCQEQALRRLKDSTSSSVLSWLLSQPNWMSALCYDGSPIWFHAVKQKPAIIKDLLKRKRLDFSTSDAHGRNVWFYVASSELPLSAETIGFLDIREPLFSTKASTGLIASLAESNLSSSTLLGLSSVLDAFPRSEKDIKLFSGLTDDIVSSLVTCNYEGSVVRINSNLCTEIIVKFGADVANYVTPQALGIIMFSAVFRPLQPAEQAFNRAFLSNFSRLLKFPLEFPDISPAALKAFVEKNKNTLMYFFDEPAKLRLEDLRAAGSMHSLDASVRVPQNKLPRNRI